MTRRISQEALDHLKRWEGLVLHAYDDADGARPPRFIKPGDPVRGTLTIGYGHTATVKPGQRITESEATALLRGDLAVFEAAVSQAVKVALTEGQFGALVSFAFNVGVGAFMGSTLLRKLNAGQYDAVPGELAKWNKTTISGQRVVSRGLSNRRAAEAGLWARGEFVASNTVPAQAQPPVSSATQEAGTLGGVAAAAAAAAPALASLGGLPLPLSIAIVASIAALAGIWMFRRRAA